MGDLFAETSPPPYSEILNLEAPANSLKLILERGMDRGRFPRDLDVDFVAAPGPVLVSPAPLRVVRERPPAEVTDLAIEFVLADIMNRPPGVIAKSPCRARPAGAGGIRDRTCEIRESS